MDVFYLGGYLHAAMLPVAAVGDNECCVVCLAAILLHILSLTFLSGSTSPNSSFIW